MLLDEGKSSTLFISSFCLSKVFTISMMLKYNMGELGDADTLLQFLPLHVNLSVDGLG